MRTPFRRTLRKGISSVQAAVMIAVIAIVVVASVRMVGTSTRDELNETATNVADPTSLVNRW
jgi:Flp pilus assembly pilin Flp